MLPSQPHQSRRGPKAECTRHFGARWVPRAVFRAPHSPWWGWWTGGVGDPLRQTRDGEPGPHSDMCIAETSICRAEAMLADTRASLECSEDDLWTAPDQRHWTSFG
ncbi:hypothetical protein PAPYR_12610 [Paratrimastix pyriformis]|uniref:Uncharacterized protein n=1 Tax=Paratrimastix pyriformis TaxID=342808 RepID=A0ABQ8U432_9EUKA|nr:hypothetical protein PAPYR_12610 [Paratrimastix pyriformis]